MGRLLGLRVGEWVEVRSEEEILSTLDKNGRLDELPFMPQMLRYCGKRLRVHKRAHKTCDTVNKTGGVRMKHAVHLEGMRCDGEAYGGCQAACVIFWKEAWLKRVKGPGRVRSGKPTDHPSAEVNTQPDPLRCTVYDVMAGTTQSETGKDGATRYSCQITQLPRATSPLSSWNLAQYWQDLMSGNIRPAALVKGFAYASYYNVVESGRGPTARLIKLYDFLQSKRGGVPFPRKRGVVPKKTRAPSAVLNLQPGEWVRVKPYEDVLKTLHENNRNHGLYFDAEMVPYCGGLFRVRSRVTRILDEQTGEMMHFKNDCIILEGAVCESRYSYGRYFCPRAIYPYWREIWLERISEAEEPVLAPCAIEPSKRGMVRALPRAKEERRRVTSESSE